MVIKMKVIEKFMAIYGKKHASTLAIYGKEHESITERKNKAG